MTGPRSNQLSSELSHFPCFSLLKHSLQIEWVRGYSFNITKLSVGQPEQLLQKCQVSAVMRRLYLRVTQITPNTLVVTDCIDKKCRLKRFSVVEKIVREQSSAMVTRHGFESGGSHPLA
jgi:hypothetical protein